MDIIEQVNQYLLETEKFSNDFLPLQDTLNPIRNNLEEALKKLKIKSESSNNLEDEVFYLNRYTDLIKKVESIFEAKNKRLQQTLYTLTKLLPVANLNNNDQNKNAETENVNISPEKLNEIIKILQNDDKEG